MTQVRAKVDVYSVIKRRYERGVDALFDTGARSTFISDELAEKVGYHPYDKPRPVPLAVREKEGEIIGWSPVMFVIEEVEIPYTTIVQVVKGLREPVIIGTSYMEEYRIRLDLEEGKPYLEKYPPRAELI
ncbi:MAG: hypothetical protein DRJ59_05900 [Thermoprotei archaeon]|nr:MAG: hypothetical protein DRJ59_05900 [Thermoprotei archaeon]